MSLSPFDQAFRDDALPAIYAEFGEAMSYTPPGGSAVEGVLVIPDEQDRQHSAGEYGQMRSCPGSGRRYAGAQRRPHAVRWRAPDDRWSPPVP